MARNDAIRTTIEPWLTVRNCAKAIVFYQSAFGAVETYRLEGPDGSLVVKLSMEGAEFWLSDGLPEAADLVAESLGGGSVRMILVVTEPDTLFRRALNSGATEIFPITEGHGWRVGRIADPFGLHWEIGRPVTA